MPKVLNLSNEVVKMRVEVKRVKVQLIRKLNRQILVLEKKKGSEADLEKLRRRADRLREEISELKCVAPDSVTKAALRTDISFEKVCRNTEASLSERAIARIATHPQFSKKIQSIKAAIKAFKEERTNLIKGKKQAESAPSQNQSQTDGGGDVGSKKSNDEDNEEKLEEDEGDKKTDEDRKEEIDVSSQESQKTSQETINEQTKQCQNEKSLTVEESSKTVSIPEEVIRIRKIVKRTRLMVISKMVKKAAILKKKKGKENQERTAEILKEIQALRSLKLDQVTTAALQENADFEKVLQDPQASPVDRAIAHIATHSRFINKLQQVKEDIKEEKAKAAKVEEKKTYGLEDMVLSENKDEESEDDQRDSEEDGDVVEEKLNRPTTEIQKPNIAEPTARTDNGLVKVPPSKIIPAPSEKPKRVEAKLQKVEATAPKVLSSSEKSSTVSKNNISKESKETKTTSKPQKKPDLPETKKVEPEKDDEGSDLSDEEEEKKEYFDDSTEERFHKQSSQSEESDDDDFFLGKVSKFKKRKSTQGTVKEKKTEKEVTGKPQETNLGKLQSVFCSALSKSSVSSQKAKSGPRIDGPRRPRLHNLKKGPKARMKAPQDKAQDLGADNRTGAFKPNRQTFKDAEQKQAGPSGAGRGRPQFEQNRNPRGPPSRMFDPPQQSLHPSWEASKKRKEQQAQITAFQGKKIRFDDD
ncbi:serum response factor-binding protein 1 [Garra rufa]|uniref:serum response factor-binding protein 1 n=1 Tax=Garra rufa TaxID=137080 RepID=UPI003CCE5D23